MLFTDHYWSSYKLSVFFTRQLSAIKLLAAINNSSLLLICCEQESQQVRTRPTIRANGQRATLPQKVRGHPLSTLSVHKGSINTDWKKWVQLSRSSTRDMRRTVSHIVSVALIGTMDSDTAQSCSFFIITYSWRQPYEVRLHRDHSMLWHPLLKLWKLHPERWHDLPSHPVKNPGVLCFSSLPLSPFA